MPGQLWSAMSDTPTARTQNGAVTHATTGVEVLDFFFNLGSYRNQEEAVIINSFKRAFITQPELSLKALFYARDVRGGQGERRLFSICMKWLATEAGAIASQLICLIPIYGCWNDMLCLMGTPVQKTAIAYWANAISNKDPLACKWAPREKSSHRQVATKLRKELSMTPKQYRKWLAAHTNVVENNMCARQWDEINFSHVPSRAMLIYSNAFKRNSSTYPQWVEGLASGKTKVNSSTLYPYEIVKSVDAENEQVRTAQWNALPDYFGGSARNVLPIIDVSGSMEARINNTTSCMDVAIGLGMYCAQRSQGVFKNKFITFHSTPSLLSIPPASFKNQVEYIRSAPWGGSTNFVATFELILDAAMRNSLPQSELPEMVLCVSDMEFDLAAGYYNSQTNFDHIKSKFSAAGYKLPDLVFWNVQSRGTGNYPVKFHENGTALVSGFSPSIMKTILSSSNITPLSIMLDTLNSERYSFIRVG